MHTPEEYRAMAQKFADGMGEVANTNACLVYSDGYVLVRACSQELHQKIAGMLAEAADDDGTAYAARSADGMYSVFLLPQEDASPGQDAAAPASAGRPPVHGQPESRLRHAGVSRRADRRGHRRYPRA
jgi:hypothetical protein